ncbi:MAG TPA: flippase-like domain-containing protein [Methylomirabilota bacterium]|nr:flippase-like domain-containing protein [Methylomirabilota bacterium]
MGRRLRTLLMVAGLGVVAYLIYQVGPAAVWDSVTALGWRLLLVLCVPYSLMVLVDTAAWRLLFRDAHPPFLILLRARLAGEAVNLSTPTASVGGEPLKAYLLRPWVPLTEGFAAVIADKTTVVTGQWLYLSAGLGAAVGLLSPPHGLVVAMSVLLVVEAIAVSGFVLVQTRGIFGGGGRLLGRFGLGPSGRYQDGLENLDRALSRFYRERLGRVAGSAALHALGWAGAGVEIYLVLRFLGIPASLGTALVIESFGAAVKFASFMIPASVGALEGGYVAFFSAFGLGGTAGLSYVLVRRMRELTWAALGYLAMSALGARPRLAEPERGGP